MLGEGGEALRWFPYPWEGDRLATSSSPAAASAASEAPANGPLEVYSSTGGGHSTSAHSSAKHSNPCIVKPRVYSPTEVVGGGIDVQGGEGSVTSRSEIAGTETGIHEAGVGATADTQTGTLEEPSQKGGIVENKRTEVGKSCHAHEGSTAVDDGRRMPGPECCHPNAGGAMSNGGSDVLDSGSTASANAVAVTTSLSSAIASGEAEKITQQRAPLGIVSTGTEDGLVARGQDSGFDGTYGGNGGAQDAGRVQNEEIVLESKQERREARAQESSGGDGGDGKGGSVAGVDAHSSQVSKVGDMNEHRRFYVIMYGRKEYDKSSGPWSCGRQHLRLCTSLFSVDFARLLTILDAFDGFQELVLCGAC